MDKYVRSGLLAAVCVVSAQASADIDFRGFASLGGGIYSEDDSTYLFVDDTFTTDPFTKFALQVKSEINDRTEVTGQLIARGEDDYQLEAEWAYVSVEVTDAMDFRVGRIRSPFFLYSDFLDVGYAYPWITPPAEVYRLPFTTVEGIDVLHNHALGNWSGSFQAYYGGLTDDTNLNGEKLEIVLDDYLGANYNISNDWLTFRLSYNEAVATLTTPSQITNELIPGLRQATALIPGFGEAEVQSIEDTLSVNELKARFYGVGLNIDVSDFLIAAEYTVLDFERQSFISNDEAWYVMVGKRFGDFTWHVTYTEQTADPDFSYVDAIPDLPVPEVQGTRAIVYSAADFDRENTISLGVRYEYGPSSAFKVEVTNLTTEVNTYFGPQDDITGTLVAFSYDLVF